MSENLNLMLLNTKQIGQQLIITFLILKHNLYYTEVISPVFSGYKLSDYGNVTKRRHYNCKLLNVFQIDNIYVIILIYIQKGI